VLVSYGVDILLNFILLPFPLQFLLLLSVPQIGCLIGDPLPFLVNFLLLSLNPLLSLLHVMLSLDQSVFSSFELSFSLCGELTHKSLDGAR
jgi:hypothetical protein